MKEDESECCECGGWILDPYRDERPEQYRQACEFVSTGKPCPLCGKPLNPIWIWRPVDPKPKTMPKGCMYSTGAFRTAWLEEHLGPANWCKYPDDEFQRRWLVADNLRLEFEQGGRPMQLLAEIITSSQIAAALDWREKHEKHVRQLEMDGEDTVFPPSREDAREPELWKAAHWRWFRDNIA